MIKKNISNINEPPNQTQGPDLKDQIQFSSGSISRQLTGDSAINQTKKETSSEPRDHTVDLFNNFERNTFLKRPELNSKVASANISLEASYMGNIKIHEVNKSGSCVRLLNVSNTVEEDLGNYTIQQMVAAMPVAVYRFPGSVKLGPGRVVTVWSQSDEVEQQPPHTFVWKEQNKWGTGPECTTVLAKPNGQVRQLFQSNSFNKNTIP